eukprot:INCI1116.2.p1 GENE.INCI1116.2~~INCI1116.2.p1  ORF type:complete len:106 (+),score=0.20 INCI1116.2:398-715(+)
MRGWPSRPGCRCAGDVATTTPLLQLRHHYSAALVLPSTHRSSSLPSGSRRYAQCRIRSSPAIPCYFLAALLPWGKILAALTTPALLCGRQARCSLQHITRLLDGR